LNPDAYFNAYGREGEDRLEVRRRKLNTVDHAQGTEPRVSKKVRFLV